MLILLSYHDTHSWTAGVLDGVKEELATADMNLELYVEFMDSKRHQPDDISPQLERLYRTKYRDIPFDLIILSDNNALNFLLPRRASLFPGVPVVFCGINNFTPSLIEGFDQVTGVAEAADFAGTIELALELQPDTLHIAIVCDNTPTGIAHIKDIRRVFPDFAGRLEFIELFNQTEEGIRKSLRNLPEKSIIFLLSFYHDRTGRKFTIPEQAKLVTENADVPVYTAWDISLGYGVIGGVMTNGWSQGITAAKLGIRILGGESPRQIPVIEKSPNVSMLDYRIVKHFDLSLEKLSTETVFINKPITFYSKHTRIIWITLLIFLIQFLLISYLILNVRQRRRAEQRLNEQSEQLKGVVDERTAELLLTNKELALEVDTRDKALQQERNLTQIIEKSLNEIYFFDADSYRFLFVNEGARVNTGYTQAEFLEMTPLDIKPELDSSSFEQRVASLKLGAKNNVVFETVHARKDGSTYPVEVHLQKTEYRSRPVLAAFILDITERRNAEAAIRKSEDQWNRTFNSFTDLVTLQNTDLKIVKANQTACTILNLPFDEIIGHNCYELFSGSEEPCSDCPLLVTRDSFAPYTREMYHEKLGKTFLVSAAPVFDKQGELEYIAHVAKDITKMKQLESNLFQSQKMEVIGTMAGGIAHDFNNILSAIIGYAEFIREEVPKESSIGKDIAEILAAGNRATDLVKKILTFSHQAATKKQVIRPDLIVKEALKMLRATLPATVAIQEDIDPDCGRVMADPITIQQIVVNLCTNGLQAMVEQKGTLHVGLQRRELSAAETGEKEKAAPGPFVVLTVRDSGCGMAQSIVDRIFEPYFTTKEVGKGTGLGLAIVHGAVEEHKGFIEVDSSVGKGTVFSVYFPLIEEFVAPATVLEKKDRGEVIPGLARILVVDDELLLVKINETRLKSLGYQVTAVSDSREALEIFRSQPDSFDLLITDQTMPGLTGAELAKAILALRPSLPVIMCTGHSDVVSEEEAISLGIRKYIFKPLRGDELLDAVDEVLAEK